MKRRHFLGFGIWDLGFGLFKIGIWNVGFLLAVLQCGCSLPSKGAPAAQGSVVINYWDIRGGDTAEPSYDTKFAVSVDGIAMGESPVADRYAPKTMEVRLAPGEHLLVVEGMALKNGVWEKRMAANGNPFDHRMEKKIDASAGQTVVVNYLVPDRRDRLSIRLGNVPPTPTQPGADSSSASR